MANNGKFYSVFRSEKSGRYIWFDSGIPYTPSERARGRFLRKLKPHLSVFEKGQFGTLTYGTPHLPAKSSDISSFFGKVRAYTKKNERSIVRGYYPYNDGTLFYAWRLDIGEQKKRPHFHYLSNINYIPKGELRKMWGKGFVYPERIYSVKGAYYDLGKYVGKSIGNTHYDLSHVKRSFGTSRNISPVKTEWKKVGHYSEDWTINFVNENLKQENQKITARNNLLKFLS